MLLEHTNALHDSELARHCISKSSPSGAGSFTSTPGSEIGVKGKQTITMQGYILIGQAKVNIDAGEADQDSAATARTYLDSIPTLMAFK
jgi:hypothetical protein